MDVRKKLSAGKRDGKRKEKTSVQFGLMECAPTSVGGCVMNACSRGIIPIRALVHLLCAADSLHC